MFEVLEKIEDISDKELQEVIEEWVKRSELVVHQLNQKKL